MNNPDARPHIGRVGYKISLMRVAPGAEGAVASKLETAIKKYTGSRPICTLKVFGLYDLCSIYRTRDFQGGPSRGGPIEGIRGGNKILAFHWKAPGNSEQLNIEGAEGKVWGLLFFRFNEDLAKEHGANIETSLVSYWHDWQKQQRRDVAFDIFGTTGWAELLFVLRAKQFKNITDAFARISEQKVHVGPTEKDVVLAPAKTFSLVGLDFSLTQSRNARALLKEFPEKFTAREKIFPVLHVTCPPASMKKVHELAKDRLGRGFVTYGLHDFVFTPDNGSWGEFIRNVIQLRSKISGHVYSTAVGILSTGDGKFGNPTAYELPEREGIQIAASLSKLFHSWGPVFEDRLRNLHFGLSNLMQDPLIGDCFNDLQPFVKSRLPVLLKQLSPKDDDAIKLVDDLIDVTTYGAEERAHGAFLSLEHVEASLSPTKGGIQRILQAASVIPRELLSRIRKQWYGFMVSGYQNAFFASHYEIINLPFIYLFKPENWFGLLHESGHAALFDSDFFNIDSPEVSALIHQAVLGAPFDSLEFLSFKNLLFEIGADMFGFYLCYGDSFDTYLRNTIPCMAKKGEPLKTDYVIRCFAIAEYHKHLLSRSRDDFPLKFNVGADLQEFSDQLDELRWCDGTEEDSEEEVRLSFLSVKPFIEIFHHRLKRLAPSAQLSVDLEMPETKMITDTVLRGEIYYDRISRPDTFILSLKAREKDLTLASKLAAITSLWNSSVTHRS
jgi:hypothetical protein